MGDVSVSVVQLATWRAVMEGALQAFEGDAPPSEWLLDRLRDQALAMRHLLAFDAVPDNGRDCPSLRAWQGWVVGLGMELNAQDWGDDPLVGAERDQAWRARGVESAPLLAAAVHEALTAVLAPTGALEFEAADPRAVADRIVVTVLELVPRMAEQWANEVLAFVVGAGDGG